MKLESDDLQERIAAIKAKYDVERSKSIGLITGYHKNDTRDGIDKREQASILLMQCEGLCFRDIEEICGIMLAWAKARSSLPKLDALGNRL